MIYTDTVTAVWFPDSRLSVSVSVALLCVFPEDVLVKVSDSLEEVRMTLCHFCLLEMF